MAENVTNLPNKRVRVVLVAPHTHAGREYGAGDNIEITVAQRQWLIGLGKVAETDPKKEH